MSRSKTMINLTIGLGNEVATELLRVSTESGKGINDIIQVALLEYLTSPAAQERMEIRSHRGVRKGTRRGRYIRLTAHEVTSVRQLIEENPVRSQAAIARATGVTIKQVSSIRRGRTFVNDSKATRGYEGFLTMAQFIEWDTQLEVIRRGNVEARTKR